MLWGWILKKIEVIGGLISLLILLIFTFRKQGKDEQKLEYEEEKFKEQESRHEKNTETLKVVEDVKNKNALSPDSDVVDRLRSKWQRD